jgi:hypothetical protein
VWTRTSRPDRGRARGSVGSAPTGAIAPSARSPAHTAGSSDTCWPRSRSGPGVSAVRLIAAPLLARGLRSRPPRLSLATLHVRWLASQPVTTTSH